jgi:hypothetical protein
MALLRRTLPTAVAIAIGIFVLAALFTSNPLLDAIGTYLIQTAVIIAAFALFLGLLNVLRVHAGKIHSSPQDAGYSAVLLVALFTVLVFGLIPVLGMPSGPTQPVVEWIFQNVQVPLQASLAALIVFFIVTAAYRLLLMRNVESVVMLIVALLVLVGQVTVGLLPVVPGIRNWILNVAAMAGVRGIVLGVALGVLLTSIRLFLGVERPYSD